jgi:hypothetical protein
MSDLYNLKLGHATPDDLAGLNTFTVTADLSSATWNTAAAHEIAQVSGLVRVAIIARVTVTGDDTSGDTATISLGWDGDVDGMIAATKVDALAAGELWYDATPTTIGQAYGTSALDFVVNNVDIGYTIAAEAATAGEIEFYVFWEAISSGASVSEGTGVAFS